MTDQLLPMISVCMATYNAERYIEQQIASILCQLKTDDELIVSDDLSTDTTCNIVNSFSDPRIQLISNPNPGSPVRNFGYALQHARGELIFFADQDDVWRSDKIIKTLATVRGAEKKYGTDTPLLVHTDLIVVDCNLKVLAPSFWKFQNLNPKLAMCLNRVMPQNFVTGCTVMINRPLAKLAMPIPKDAVMHDWWLALVCVLFGQVICLDESTILYRQHGNNSVGAKRWGIKWIVHLAFSSKDIRVSMLRNMRQAQALLDRYRDRMTAEQQTMVEAYASLFLMSKMDRVRTMLKYRFFKHGVIRNIGFIINLFMLDNLDVKFAPTNKIC